MIAVAQANVLHLGADFQGCGGTLHLEVFGQLHRVAILQLVAVRIADDTIFLCGCDLISDRFR